MRSRLDHAGKWLVVVLSGAGGLALVVAVEGGDGLVLIYAVGAFFCSMFIFLAQLGNRRRIVPEARELKPHERGALYALALIAFVCSIVLLGQEHEADTTSVNVLLPATIALVALGLAALIDTRLLPPRRAANELVQSRSEAVRREAAAPVRRLTLTCVTLAGLIVGSAVAANRAGSCSPDDLGSCDTLGYVLTGASVLLSIALLVPLIRLLRAIADASNRERKVIGGKD